MHLPLLYISLFHSLTNKRHVSINRCLCWNRFSPRRLTCFNIVFRFATNATIQTQATMRKKIERKVYKKVSTNYARLKCNPKATKRERSQTLRDRFCITLAFKRVELDNRERACLLTTHTYMALMTRWSTRPLHSGSRLAIAHWGLLDHGLF